MLTSIRNIWRPDNYHGWNKRPPFFEGWYFKLVDPTGTHALAVIPGVFLAADPADSHCFVQTLIGNTGHSTYHRYPLDQFHADRDRFDVRIGPNHFSAQSITLDIAAPDRTLRGEVDLCRHHPLARHRPLPWHHGLVHLHPLHAVLSRRGQPGPQPGRQPGRGWSGPSTSPRAGAISKRTGAAPFPGPGCGCRPTISTSPVSASARPSPPSPGWAPPFGASSSAF